MTELLFEEIEHLQNLETINEKKDWLQKHHSLNKWLKDKKGYLEWCTGTGKTMALCKIAKHCEDRIEGWTTYVIVPTSVLKDQFEKTLKFVGVKNYKVFVVNTYTSLIAKGEVMKCNLLIVDKVCPL